MKIIADTHVHVYPCYDQEKAIGSLFDNMAKIDANAVKVAMLAERADCSWYKELSGAKTILGGVRVERFDDENVLLLRNGDESLYLFPGRQIVTSERVEILSLMADVTGLDGLDASQVVKAVIAGGGLPVLSWAPGKWFFSRKSVVKSVIDEYTSGGLFLGDTTLRPIGWGVPGLMRCAGRKGMTVVAGSDPLPFAGEEGYMGCYASLFDAPFDANRPAFSMRAAFASQDTFVGNIGRRCNFLKLGDRLFKNARSKSQP